jgi:hypothetical protein
MGVENGRMMAYLSVHGEVLSRRYHDGARVTVHCRLPVEFLGALQREPDVTVRLRTELPTKAEEVA